MKKVYQITGTNISPFTGSVQLNLVPGDETEASAPKNPGDKLKEAMIKHSDTIPKDLQALMIGLADAMTPPPGAMMGPPRESSILMLRMKEYEDLGRPTVGQFLVLDLEVMTESEKERLP